MEIKIIGCIDCPFKSMHIDSWDNLYECCELIQYNKRKTSIGGNDYFIEFYKNGKVKSENKITLNNCPLLTESYTIKL